ncbi:MAG: AI-2E family transporter [Acidobacteria bacterium]|nr:AI-2E family transporter [Acidobacteriota bacterium]
MSREDIRYARVQTTSLVIIALAILGVMLFLLRPVLVPFVLALLLSYCLSPVVDVQMRFLRLSKGLAWIGTAILGVAALTLLGLIIASTVASLTASLGSYQAQFGQLEDWVVKNAPIESLGLKPNPETGRFFSLPENAANAVITGVAAELTSLISNGATVLIFLIFILYGRKREGRSRATAALLQLIESRVQLYIIQMVFIAGGAGLLIGSVYWALGVEFALLFGFLTFLLNFIPTIGTLVALALPVPVILLNPTLPLSSKILALTIPSVIQFIIGNIVQPKLQGDALDLHPVVVLMALIFWGMIWGTAGLFLATPITAVIKIVCEQVPGARPFAQVLAGDLDPLLGLAVDSDVTLPPAQST